MSDTGASNAARTILHVDMDAFYVSVELRRHPELRGKPVVVGGTGPRGVVAAASYEARRFGVFSAMPSARARQLCPNAVFLSGDHDLYAQVSAQVHEVFHSVTPLVEGIALDEAFLDVTGAMRLLGDGAQIAALIRQRIAERTELMCSVGVAPNKFLAKVASKRAKPVADAKGVRPGKGVVIVRPGEETTFLHPMPVRALWGVGPKTREQLERYGLTTVGELAAFGETALVAALGPAQGRHLYALAFGRDDRAVEPERAAKSIGHEETYPRDLFDTDELRTEIVRLSDAVAGRLRRSGVGARTITLKVRFAGFRTITRSVTEPTPLTTAAAIAQSALALFADVDVTPGIRLLGVSGSNLDEPAEQLSFDLETAVAPGHPAEAARAAVVLEQEWHDATDAIDAIRQRFGTAAIAPASTLRNGRVRPVRTGEQQWGPDTAG